MYYLVQSIRNDIAHVNIDNPNYDLYRKITKRITFVDDERTRISLYKSLIREWLK